MEMVQGVWNQVTSMMDGDGEKKKTNGDRVKVALGRSFFFLGVLFNADGAGHFWLLAACAHIQGCIWAPFLLSGGPGQ